MARGVEKLLRPCVGRYKRPSILIVGSVDAEIVDRCRAGDPQGWELLVERYAGFVDAIVRRGFRLDIQVAEDVFQEVFARLYEHLDSIRDDSALRAWIGQTARRLAIDELRRSSRESPSIANGGVPELAAPDPPLEQLDEALLIRAEVDALPEPYRDVVVRFFIRDQSYRTIGAELDIAPGTIASRISRALAMLRDRLDAPPPDPSH